MEVKLIVNIKNYAASHRLTVAKTRDLCTAVLGEIPADLTDDHIIKLDRALSVGAASLPESSIQLHEPRDIEQARQVVEIVGVKVLQKNLLLFLQTLKAELAAEKFKIDSLLFQTEQSFYNQLGQYQVQEQNNTLARINRNSNLWSLESIDSADVNGDSDELEMLTSIQDLMKEFV